MRLSTLLLSFLLIFSACDKCRNESCFTPPPPFTFVIVDSETKENLFTNGTFNEDDITITDDEDNPIEFNFISENDLNKLQILSIGWETEEANYNIIIADQVNFNFYVDAERTKEDCCSFTRIHEQKIEGIDHEIEPTSGDFVILVEL